MTNSVVSSMDKELDRLFQQAYGQDYVAQEDLPENARGIKKQRNVVSPDYSAFLAKRADLEHYIDKFKPKDFVYYFRDKSKESGCYYTICNMHRDMGIFKKLLTIYAPVEIGAMIEFLFESGQTYLDPKTVQPTVLNSGWRIQIYADMYDWIDGKFDPKKKITKKESNAKREWKSTGRKVKVGEW